MNPPRGTGKIRRRTESPEEQRSPPEEDLASLLPLPACENFYHAWTDEDLAHIDPRLLDPEMLCGIEANGQEFDKLQAQLLTQDRTMEPEKSSGVLDSEIFLNGHDGGNFGNFRAARKHKRFCVHLCLYQFC